jgi:hypothetical protein
MLKFDEKTHVYSDDKTGIIYPSVTQIIREILIPEMKFSSTNAMEKGKIIHKTLELLDNNNLKDYDQRLDGYIKAWNKFKLEFKVIIKEIEIQLCDELKGFAGTIDRILEIGLSKKICICDIKTGSYYPSYSIQTAAYRILYNKKVDLRFDVILKEDGSYKSYQHDINSLDETIFLNCLNIYKWRSQNGCISNRK